MRDTYFEALQAVEAARRPGELRIRPHDAVEAIAQAGLLLDLPEPGEFPDGAVEWMFVSGYIYYQDGLITVRYDDRDEDGGPACLAPEAGALKIVDADDARDLALALLAAAHHMEKETR